MHVILKCGNKCQRILSRKWLPLGQHEKGLLFFIINLTLLPSDFQKVMFTTLIKVNFKLKINKENCLKVYINRDLCMLTCLHYCITRPFLGDDLNG